MQLFVLDICGFSLSDLACFCSGLFRPEEFAVLIKILLYRFSLSVISLVVFITLGANIVAWIGLSWMLGALLGGLLPILNPSWKILWIIQIRNSSAG